MHASELRSHDRELTRQVFGCCNPSIETVEAVYWKSVESGTPQLTVHYAADLRTNELGSGFPVAPTAPGTAADAAGVAAAAADGSTTACTRSSSSNASSSSSTEASVGGSPQERQCHPPAPPVADCVAKTEPHHLQHQQQLLLLQQKQQQEPEQDYNYATHPWNLARLARVEGSLLRHYHRDVPGVTSPWLYVGTVFSSFCWHTEDNFFAACNYHHWGSPKVCWVLLYALFCCFLFVFVCCPCVLSAAAAAAVIVGCFCLLLVGFSRSLASVRFLCCWSLLFLLHRHRFERAVETPRA